MQIQRILTVHSVLVEGGASNVAIDDTIYLRNAGFEVGFACEEGQLTEKLNQINIPLHRLFFVDPLRYPRFIRYLFGVPISIAILLYLVIKYKYDFFYVQHRQSGIPATVVSWITGAKYVFHLQGELGKNHKGRFFTPLGKNVISCSEQGKRNMIKYFGVHSDSIIVIPNATETAVVKADQSEINEFNRQWSIPNDSLVVGCVAMLVEIKAHNILVNAWKKVVLEFPNAILILTGKGPLRSDIESQCVELGISSSIRFVGFVDDISIIYSRIDLNVLASRSEGMALGILDGFAYEVPAVCTAASGMPEIVIDGKTGNLVALDNPDELASALIELLADVETRERMGKAGKKMVVERFSYKKRELALAEYFKSLV